MKFKSLRGMDDLFSIDLAKWQTLETAFKSVFSKFNAGEVRNPILESTDLFARSVGSSSDIVNKELYTFCLLYTSPSPRDRTRSRMPSSA